MTVAPVPSGSCRRRYLGRPETMLGRRALVLAASAFVWLAFLSGLAMLDIADWGPVPQFVLGVAGLSGLAVAIAGGVEGLMAVVRGERSLVLAAPLLFGGFALLLVLGELFVPH